MTSRLFLISLLLTIALGACSASATPEPTLNAPDAKITLQTNPNPASVGDVELIFTVENSQGEPVPGADFDVIADHVDMSGMTMHGKATDQGGGRYSLIANLSMEGNWKLTLQVREGELNHKEDVMIKVQ